MINLIHGFRRSNLDFMFGAEKWKVKWKMVQNPHYYDKPINIILNSWHMRSKAKQKIMIVDGLFNYLKLGEQ